MVNVKIRIDAMALLTSSRSAAIGNLGVAADWHELNGTVAHYVAIAALKNSWISDADIPHRPSLRRRDSV